jgi:hypothetical protein
MSNDPRLQGAIAKALELEAKVNGTWVDPSLPKPPTINYIAIFNIGGKLQRIASENFDAFKKGVEKIQTLFPNIPVDFFEVKEPQ